MNDDAKAKAIEAAAARQAAAAAAAAAAAGKHVHNDNGEQIEKGRKLITYCTCGQAVASDDI